MVFLRERAVFFFPIRCLGVCACMCVDLNLCVCVCCGKEHIELLIHVFLLMLLFLLVVMVDGGGGGGGNDAILLCSFSCSPLLLSLCVLHFFILNASQTALTITILILCYSYSLVVFLRNHSRFYSFVCCCCFLLVDSNSCM